MSGIVGGFEVIKRVKQQETFIQDMSVNRAILQHCFFLVRQHWGGRRYRHFALTLKSLN